MTDTVSGHASAQFSAVKTAFERNFAELGEVGASVCLV